ncbi:MAG: diacylglycerol kinase family lipid kinase [Clostridia bacterium]|nr:diacylglycerol kinase family lipid kinase [Clostridia bacterium]
MAELLFICNPVAGNGAAMTAIEQVKRILDERGADYEVRFSQYPEHSKVLALQAAKEGHGCIVAVGGDGTVREVACALIGTDIPLGIIPCGTGNDYVKPLRIPCDTALAVDILLSGGRRRVDVGRANDNLYINVAGFGFDVDVLDSTEIYKKKCRSGKVAYIRSLIHALSGLRLRKTVIKTEDGTERRFNALIVVAGIGTHIGGGMNITPKADPSDGLLDICVAHDVTKLTVLRFLPKLLKGRHVDSKYVTYFNATRAEAVCEPISRIQVDGEVMEGTPVVFEIEKAALTVVVKKDA